MSAKRHKLARRLVKVLDNRVLPKDKHRLTHELADTMTPSQLTLLIENPEGLRR